MELLEISQIIFNFTATIAIVVLAVLFSVIAYEIIRFIGGAKKLASDVKEESVRMYEKLDKFLLAVTSLSFVSKLFKKHKKHED